MEFETQELISQMIRTALLATNDNEMLSSIRGVQRKIARLGLDPNDLSVHHAEQFVSTAAANAIRETRQYREVYQHIMSSRHGTIQRFKTIMTNGIDQGDTSSSVEAEHIGGTKVFITRVIIEAGIEGISRSEVQYKDPLNKGIPKRFAEIMWDQGIVFELYNKNIVHKKYASYHPAAYARFEQARQIHLEKGGKAREEFLKGMTHEQ